MSSGGWPNVRFQLRLQADMGFDPSLGRYAGAFLMRNRTTTFKAIGMVTMAAYLFIRPLRFSVEAEAGCLYCSEGVGAPSEKDEMGSIGR